jgi:hypothetical protein
MEYTRYGSAVSEMIEEAIWNEISKNRDDYPISSVASFDELGIMESEDGFVIKMNDGSEYQVTLIRSDILNSQ